MTYKIWPRTLCNALLIISLTFLQSCKKDEFAPSDDKTLDYDNKENSWIYEKMKHWYLWNDHIPNSFEKTYLNKNAEEYFESLLYKRNDTYGDRFSYIKKRDDSGSKAQNGTTTESDFGFEYKYMNSQLKNQNGTVSNIYLYIVFYVHPNSPADKASMKRGDIIYKINDSYITSTDKLSSYNNVSLRLCKIENQKITFKDSDPTINLSRGNYTTSPIWASVILTKDSKKVGYLCYKSFTEGSEQLLYNAFKNFKDNGVSDLVLDLRYNTGGRLSVAQHLGSLIIPEEHLGKVYFKQQPNDIIKNSNEINLESKTLKNTTILNSKLELTRLYVLTTSATASASETTILCAAPYLSNVYVIGHTTRGKNQSSVEFLNDTWSLNPIIARLFNCEDKTFKETGIVPDFELNEDQNLPYTALGNPEEPLLNVALYHIENGSFPTRSKSSAESGFGELTIFNNSVGGNILTLDELTK